MAFPFAAQAHRAILKEGPSHLPLLRDTNPVTSTREVRLPPRPDLVPTFAPPYRLSGRTPSIGLPRWFYALPSRLGLMWRTL